MRSYSQISVIPCEPSISEYIYTLTNPDGEEEVTISRSSVYFDIDFDRPVGTYTLTVATPETDSVKDFVILEDKSLQFRFLNPSSGMPQETLGRGQSAEIEIHGYQPGTQLQISFYGPPQVAEPEKQEAAGLAYAPSVIEPWQVTTSEAGTYRGAIPFPAPLDAQSGDYTVTVCPVDCPMEFVNNRVFLPKMAWTRFNINPIPMAYTVVTKNSSAMYLSRDLFGDAKETFIAGPSNQNSEPDMFVWPDYWYSGPIEIAYQSNLQGTYDIWTQESTREGEFSAKHVTFDQDGDEWEPNSSSDGVSILYRAGGDQDGQGEIRTVNIDGTHDLLLAGHSILGHAPTWSPDGKRIAYDAKRSGDENYQVYVFDLDAGKERQLTKCRTNCRFPNWSPDGREIAYHETLGIKKILPLFRYGRCRLMEARLRRLLSAACSQVNRCGLPMERSSSRA